METIQAHEMPSTIHCDGQTDSEVPASESAPSLSEVSGGTSCSKRDMRAELQAWKEKKATLQAQQKGQKSLNPEPFKVHPRTAPSPSRTPSFLPSENAPSTTKAQNKTPCKTPGNLARQALGERSPNTMDCSNAGRSVSPLARQLYKPAARVRPKTPEPVQLASRMTTQAKQQPRTQTLPQRQVSPQRAPSSQKRDTDDLVCESKPSTIRIGLHNVCITASSGIDIAKVLEAKQFKDWADSIGKQERITVSKVHIQSVDMFGSRVGFIKFEADAKVDDKKVPGIVFMRGGSVAILVILHHKSRQFALITHQPRVPVCLSGMAEIPAGMLDGDGNFAGVAAKEMKEETGIEITQEDLVDMTQLTYGDSFSGIFPSCGGSDEFNRIFLFQKFVTDEELDSLNGKLTGVAEEGETIKLQIIPLEALWRTSPDSKALAAYLLYKRLFALGRIPQVLQESDMPLCREATSSNPDVAMELMDYLPAAATDSTKTQAESKDVEDCGEEIAKPVLGLGQPCPAPIAPLPPSVSQVAPPLPNGPPPELPLDELPAEVLHSPVRETPLAAFMDFNTTAATEEADSPVTEAIKETPLAAFMDLDKATTTEEANSPVTKAIKETPLAAFMDIDKATTTDESDSPVTKAIKETPLAGFMDLDKATTTDESDSPVTKAIKETPLAAFMDCNKQTITSASPSPAPRTSFGSLSPSNGGFISAYEERVGLPRQPPPSPATPSPALSIAMSAATLAGIGEREQAAEFAREAGAALVRITSEERQFSPIDECKARVAACDSEKEQLAETPRHVPSDLAVESPAPLSPLSLGSASEEQES